MVLFPYILFPHSSSESNHWLSFSCSVNGIQLILFISFNSPYIYLKTCTMGCNSCSSSKINFFLFKRHLQSRYLNYCFWWQVNITAQRACSIRPLISCWTLHSGFRLITRTNKLDSVILTFQTGHWICGMLCQHFWLRPERGRLTVQTLTSLQFNFFVFSSQPFDSIHTVYLRI